MRTFVKAIVIATLCLSSASSLFAQAVTQEDSLGDERRRKDEEWRAHRLQVEAEEELRESKEEFRKSRETLDRGSPRRGPLTPLADLSAQKTLPLTPGARVRVTTSMFKRVTWSRDEMIKEGTLVALNADSLVLKTKGRSTPLPIPLSSIEKFEVSRGQRRNVGEGAGFGLLIGAGIGAALGAMGGGGSCDDDCFSRKEIAFVGGAALGVLGAVIGAGVGVAVPTEQWERVPLERVRLSVAPQRHGGVRLAASFIFSTSRIGIIWPKSGDLRIGVGAILRDRPSVSGGRIAGRPQRAAPTSDR